jgi:subtilisin family serine protease
MTLRSSPWLAAAAAAAALSPVTAAPAGSPPARIVVGYGHSQSSAAATLERELGAEPLAAIPQLDVHVVTAPPDRAAAVLGALRSSPLVRYAERDTLVRALRIPDDELWPTQWSPRKTRAPAAWDVTTGSARIVVAVADTGVDPAQPDLKGKITPGFDFVNGGADALDDNGHGTAVAGIIAARSNNGIGVAGYCWACQVMPVKVLGGDGTGFASTVAQGIVWATDHGAAVINASLGGPDEDAAVAAAAQYAWSHGALLVAAAGNDSSSILDYPAALPNVLSVGASDENDRLYGFSNSGAAIAAPGENTTIDEHGGYELFFGTSSAAPVVSGIAGLALAAAPDAGPSQLTNALEQSAVPMDGVAFGRADASAALRALGAVPPSVPGGDRASGSGGRVRRQFRGRLGPRHSFSVPTGAGVLRATLSVDSRRRIVLELHRAGRLVSSSSGRRRIRLVTRVTRGRYRLVIPATGASGEFVLTVACPRPS